ncbi:MAG: PLP-dependent aminotransferase family protein [Vicinamibacteria bacterium]
MVQWEPIALDRNSEEPLYLQICVRIRARIASGELAPGEKLPPSRDLAALLGINRNTIANAYDELVKTGDVRSHVGQGTFVAGSFPDPERASFRYRFSRAVEASADLVRPAAALPSDTSDVIDFASLVPDEDLFPVEPFRRVLDLVLRHEGKKLLQYGPTAGHPPLRAYIAERLRRRGVVADAENVLIVNGSQQALDLISRGFLDPGDRVVVESPTYTIILPLLAQYHAQIDPIPMTDRGMDLVALETALARSRPKLIFTMPTFHNPTGITMDLESRRRLLELALRHGTPVVEDDFDSDLRFDGDALPPLKALDDRDAVLHIGTFSKGLFPGLRLGWIVAPRPVVETLGRSKLISDYHTSLLLQAAVYEFCRAGHYDRHLKRLASIYREKSRTLTRALERFFPRGVGWTRPEGGYAYWITLPESLSAEELLEESVKAGVVFTPGSFFFARGGGDRFLRLSISRVPLARIEEGIEKLGRVLARYGQGRREKGRAPALEHEAALHI